MAPPPKNPCAPAPPSSGPPTPEMILEKRVDMCLADGLVKSDNSETDTNGMFYYGLGAVLGLVASAVVLKKKFWPIPAGVGIGIGMAMGNCRAEVLKPLPEKKK